MKQRATILILTIQLILAATFGSGCQLLSYAGPSGERLSRLSLGLNTSISSLSVETGSNGLQRVELRGYQNDSTQALGTVTEAAVRSAIQSAK